MAEDPELRRNRLALLNAVASLPKGIVDFAELPGFWSSTLPRGYGGERCRVDTGSVLRVRNELVSFTKSCRASSSVFEVVLVRLEQREFVRVLRHGLALALDDAP